jgi:hypothetical protein
LTFSVTFVVSGTFIPILCSRAECMWLTSVYFWPSYYIAQLRMLPLRKSRHEWNDNIKMHLQEIVWPNVDWILSSQIRGKLKAVWTWQWNLRYINVCFVSFVNSVHLKVIH